MNCDIPTASPNRIMLLLGIHLNGGGYTTRINRAIIIIIQNKRVRVISKLNNQTPLMRLCGVNIMTVNRIDLTTVKYA